MSFDLSGEFSAEGLYWDNYALVSDDTVTNSFYRGYVSLFPKISVGDTSIILKVNMRDETWGDKASLRHWTILMSGHTSTPLPAQRPTTTSTSSVAYLSHKFAAEHHPRCGPHERRMAGAPSSATAWMPRWPREGRPEDQGRRSSAPWWKRMRSWVVRLLRTPRRTTTTPMPCSASPRPAPSSSSPCIFYRGQEYPSVAYGMTRKASRTSTSPLELERHPGPAGIRG
ncbi:MAG: hypothetical protein MZU91_02765 [Desulfosudis oleivorans]|nr:hypothetical protein [Desulfosudis oleivorans]